MTELNKEEALAELVSNYLTAIKANDSEAMTALAASVPEEDREATLKVILAAAEKDEDILANAASILASLQEADRMNDDATEAANAEADAEVPTPALAIVQDEVAVEATEETTV